MQSVMFGQYQNRTEVRCLFVYPVVKLQKFPYINVSLTHFRCSRKHWVLFTTLLLD